MNLFEEARGQLTEISVLDAQPITSDLIKHTRIHLMNVAHTDYRCVRCSIQGIVVVKWHTFERHVYTSLTGTKPIVGIHHDLFAIKNGKFVMMNVDHILPVSKGGSQARTNLQLMCERCNSNKGNKVTLAEWHTILSTPEHYVHFKHEKRIAKFVAGIQRDLGIDVEAAQTCQTSWHDLARLALASVVIQLQKG